MHHEQYDLDISFDDIHGLFNAIYYGDKKLLAYYKDRFSGVKFFISPDYSLFGDIQKIENLKRVWKARIVALWFILELHAVMIPNIMYYSEDALPITCCGLEKCLELFRYAIDHGIKIVIPGNSLRDRNIERRMQNERK